MQRWESLGVLALLLVSTGADAQAPGRAGALAADARGVLVDGWTGRLDSRAEKQGRKLTDARFWSADDALLVKSGPPAIYWNSSAVGRGSYTVTATFIDSSRPPNRETYGLFMGGSELDGRVPNYLYCAMYGQGMYSIKHRYGDELHSLVERRSSGAIHLPDASGRTTNEIAWRVDKESVACVVNGTAVASFPRAVLIGDGKLESTDGMYGLRVNHNLEVRVTGFRVASP